MNDMADKASKKAPPKLPGDTGYAIDAWKKSVAARREARDVASPKVPPGMEKAMNEAEGVMSDLDIPPETPGAQSILEPGSAVSPEADIIAKATELPPETAQKVWDAAQTRDDLQGVSAEDLAVRLQRDFGLLRSLLGGSETKPAEAPKETTKSESGGPEIEPEAEKVM